MKRGVIFDLDGVIVSTDDLHFQAWKAIADREDIPFDRRINDRLRGVSRMESLEIILEKSPRSYTKEEKTALAEAKNDIYKESLQQLSARNILPGVERALAGFKAMGVKLAIGSSSKNAAAILEHIGLTGQFDAVVGGQDITRSKPDPEVFLVAAQRLGLQPQDCVVIEDADAGIEAAIAAGMKAVGIGAAGASKIAHLVKPGLYRADLSEILH